MPLRRLIRQTVGFTRTAAGYFEAPPASRSVALIGALRRDCGTRIISVLQCGMERHMSASSERVPDWEQLAAQASQEKDPEKLFELVQQLLKVLQPKKPGESFPES